MPRAEFVGLTDVSLSLSEYPNLWKSKGSFSSLHPPGLNGLRVGAPGPAGWRAPRARGPRSRPASRLEGARGVRLCGRRVAHCSRRLRPSLGLSLLCRKSLPEP